MKKFVSVLLLLSFVFALCACGDSGTSAYDEKVLEIQAAIDAYEVEKAYNLCDEAMSLELDAEQQENIESLKNMVSLLCYPTTKVVQVDKLVSVTPTEIGENSYFEVGLLGEYDELFCRYTFGSTSERDLAAQEYKDYLDANFIYDSIREEDAYTSYQYVDSEGKTLGLQVFNTNYDSPDLVIFIDNDMFDADRIDKSSRKADLWDHSIILEN